MSGRETLDIVSVSTWPHLHAPLVIAAAKAGVRAIHCEKPMVTSWAQAREMARVCAEVKVQLTFNHQRRHQRRFEAPFIEARKLLRAGAIGELRRFAASCGDILARSKTGANLNCRFIKRCAPAN